MYQHTNTQIPNLPILGPLHLGIYSNIYTKQS